MPQVTVILGSYNHGKYIGEAICSVLDQTFQDWELIITDDGSTDNSVEVIRSFEDPRIRLFCFPENRTACVASLNSFNHSQGQYIALLGSDDQFAADKLERQVRYLTEHPEIGAVFSYAEIVGEEGAPLPGTDHFYQQIFLQPNRSRTEWLNHFFFKGNCLCHPSLLIRRECFESLGFYDLRYANVTDLEYWVRLCSRYEIHIMPENLVKFRVRAKEANSSGDRPAPQMRATTETAWVLRLYNTPDFLRQFRQIFPELQLEESVPSALYPYHLARLAVDRGEFVVHRAFGLDLLYNLLGDPQAAALLEATYQFGVKQLIALTGQVDAYGYRQARELTEERTRLYQHQAELAQQIEQSQQAIAQLKDALQVSQTYTASLQQGLEQKEADLVLANQGLATAHDHLATAHAQLGAIAESRWWKLGQTLRRLRGRS
jgi:glycosyltransferase involved in cell wall biosynthesis